MAEELYFEDLQPGMTILSLRSYEITTDEIKEFAAKYDPQPFHLDEAAAEKSFFKGLAASGWMTAAVVMRLRDWLRTETEILSARRSASRPVIGVIKSRTLVYNQRDELVMRSVVNFIAPLRDPPGAK